MYAKNNAIELNNLINSILIHELIKYKNGIFQIVYVCQKQCH